MTNVRLVTVHQAAELAAGGALILDVREPDEWKACHMNGAVHVPLASLDPSSIGIGIGTQIVAVCRSGNRSGQAAEKLAAAGHDVVNMDGGMMAWNKAGLPVTSDTGQPGIV